MTQAAAVRAPTLVLGVDVFGGTILDRVESLTSSLGDPPVRFVHVSSETPVAAVVERVHEHLDELLRIQMGGPRARLDIVLVADLEQASAAGTTQTLCEGLSRMMAA